ncbi:M48 family metallopeptidase [Geobacter grbiciae]|uniref:M48 family metallopeptidase n=1 Tax=Geobacter grbiciae TaxID=155042 RepID=UPI001C00EB11|nr:SprT family zinc-dependent metalloprotease [Geobacter grbiciae]MBT1073940.1 M48 family metallopeptidase [Geobacter grbiciae]
MTTTIQIGELSIRVTKKNIKNVHLSVHPPDGHVTLAAPTGTRLEVARAYAISKLGWIREQQAKLKNQARETHRQFVERESHYLWGRRYLLSVNEQDRKPSVKLDHKRITLNVRPGSSSEKRADVLHEWHKALLHQVVPGIITAWETKLGVKVAGYFLQRMKTKWGSCNHRAGHIRINTELVKKPKDLLEYVIVHEMVHLIEKTHSARFVALLDEYYPTWREARSELNELPLSAVRWGE